MDDYIQWQSGKDVTYPNFMALTMPPQENPFGIGGRPEAIKKLELQKPNRPPTRNNPFMNVPIHAYNIPQKYGKARQTCGSECKRNFYQSLFRTPSDALWDREASERQWVTVANTSVPNEQKKFAEWLYGKNYVGKSGSIYDRYGYPYTADSLVSTGFNSAEPQNGGQVDNNYGVPSIMASPWVNNPNYGYGFGGIPGGIPMNNISPRDANYINPMPLFPTFPKPRMDKRKYQNVPSF